MTLRERKLLDVLPPLPLLLSAQFLMVLGSASYSVAAMWWLKTQLSSDSLIAFFAVLAGLPAVLFGVGAGRLADTNDRKGILIGTYLKCALLMGALLLLVQAEVPWLVVALLLGNLLLNIVLTVQEPALLAAMPHLTTESGLPRVNSLHQMLSSLGGIAGAALGGLLAGAGLEAAVSVNLLAFALCFLIVPLGHWSQAARLACQGGEKSSAVGVLAFLKTHPEITQLIALVGSFILFAAPMPALLPTLVHDHLRAGATALGTLEAAFSAGFLVGGAFSMLGLRPNTVAAIGITFLMAGTVRFGLSASHSLGLSAALLVLNGAAVAVAGIAAVTLLQTSVGEGERGRALGLASSLIALAAPLGLGFSTALLPLLHMTGMLQFTGAVLLALGGAAGLTRRTLAGTC